MENESGNTLDLLGLDVQASISCLNPFDRPPNDDLNDDLNSVTQEELEANLSTDCPISNNNEMAPTSWEQLIQSVLEDTSTQDAVDQQEYIDTKNNQEPVSAATDSEVLEMFKREIKEELETGMEWQPTSPPEPLEWQSSSSPELPQAEEREENIASENHEKIGRDNANDISDPADNENHISNPPDNGNHISNPSDNGNHISDPADNGNEISSPPDNENHISNPSDNGRHIADPADNGNDISEPAGTVNDIPEPSDNVDEISADPPAAAAGELDISIKEDISIHSEHMFTQNVEVDDCYYADTINEEDADNDLCQVEVYASDTIEGRHVDNHNIPTKMEIKDESSDDNDDEIVSNASSISIGRIEEAAEGNDVEKVSDKAEDNVSQCLSIINSDHCYSQEKITTEDRETLKQKVINYFMQQSATRDQEKIYNLANKLFHDHILDSEVDMILDSMAKQEAISSDLVTVAAAEGEREETAIQNDNVNETDKEKETTSDDMVKIEENSQLDPANIDPSISEKEMTENQKHVQEEKAKTDEIQSKEEIQKSVPSDDIDKEPTNPENEDVEMSQETDKSSVVAASAINSADVNEEDFALSQKTDTSTAKPLTELLADNISEPLEHHIFEEEFDLLCKSGSLTIDKSKHSISSDLLTKLIDFATHMQSDCKYFSSASTNIEQKLHDYIQQQFKHFQEQFKPYCYATGACEKQTVETQTDFPKITKCHRRKLNMESKNSLLRTSDKSSQYGTSSSSEELDEKLAFEVQKKKRITKRSLKNKINSSDSEGGEKKESKDNIVTDIAPLAPPSQTNHFQEYDDGINLSQYVQSEIFDIESASQQSPVPSSVEDSDASVKEEDGVGVEETISNNISAEDDEDSDSTLLFKPKKSKKPSSEDTSAVLSSPESKRSRKSRNDDVSVNNESDKENLSSERKERKSHASMDEEEKNDKEIERLINIDGLSKRSVAAGSSTKSNEKGKTKVAAAKNLNDHFDFMDVEFGSDDEVKSEAEEEVITEKQFLERRNEDIKRQMLDESSTDSEELDEEDDELLKGAASEEDDESGKNSPLVEKFLKHFVVDDSDNEVVDEDDDLDMDSDKEVEGAAAAGTASSVNNETNKEGEEDQPADLSLKENENEDESKKNADITEVEGEPPSASEMELLNDNLLFRKRGSRPQKLDKMLSDAEKRKRISKIDEELISLSSESENSDVEEIDVEPSQSTKPRAIKPMLRPDQLAGETIKAQKHENERIARLDKKHNMLDKVLKDNPDEDKNRDLILDYIKDTKTFIKVHPGIVKLLKPHQFDGVRFMYDSCYGGVDSLKKSPGSGCILAHCMGLGKTLQLIALLHTVISYKELKTTKILVLCPKSTVMNWADEIIRWLGPLRQKNLKVYTFNDTSDIYEKLSILREWSHSNHTRAGCLLIGYEAFRTLVFYHSYKNRGNVSAHRLEEIRKNVNTYLLQPGADLVICDEGHIIKNSKSAISMAVAQIVTPRRIVLTGTPIQNNLKEYYSMVNFIKPLFLGTEKEFANLYANPIKNGQHKDSGKTDIKIMKQRSFVLHKKLSKFVQRKEAELLKTFLPQKFEYVLFIPMTAVQNNLYQHILNAITNRDENYRGKGLITDYTCLRKIWTHPKVLEDAWKNAVNQRNKKELRQKQKDHNSDDDQPDDIYDSQTGQMSVTNDWWRSLVTETDLESVMPSNKLRTMFKILQMCEEKGEKCLIFSAFVAVLNVVEYFFRKITDNDATVRNELNINTHSQWILGKDYYRLDGKTPKSIRHAMINEFNNVLNKRARVFLISAKAGGQGINLIGANRVMILDTSWNPSNDQQNIFRVFRLGQKRNCYIYRLLAMGTMEEKVYSRSVTKQAMSFRVVDEQQIDRHYNMAELAELYILTIPDHSNRPTPILPQDSILARLLRSFPELVYKYHEHDSLLENKVEQELSEQEKNEAWTAYERDLQMNAEINEKPNIEDLQNKFNAPNLANYISPFSGLDVSTTNTNNNNNSGKNMSSFFGPRGFSQPLLQSLLGPNSTPTTTQQYLDMLNYYKNLGAYADLNSYSTLSAIGAGRMPGGPATSTAANPLAALGDLSMYGLPSSALQGLSTSSASPMNLTNSINLTGALPPMPTVASSAASMYTSAAPPTSVANALSSAGLTSTTSSSALSAFEQYQQSLRNTFPNMYSYAGDFGIGSSGSTILDKSKSAKNNKHSSSGGNNKNTNLPGGSKSGVNSMSLYPGPSLYLNQQQQHQQQQQQQQHQQQQQQQHQQQQHQHQQQLQQQQQHQHQQQQSRPSSRNTPTDHNKSKSATPAPPAPTSMTTSSPSNAMPPTTSSGAAAAASAAKTMTTSSNAMSSNTSKSNTNETQSNSLINYRRSESTGSSGNSLVPKQTPPTANQKRVTAEQTNGGNAANRTSTTTAANITTSNSKATTKPPLNPQTTMPQHPPSSSNQKPPQKPPQKPSTSSTAANSSTKASSAENSRTVNMGILYPKGQEKSGTNKPNSPMNMGIVYPRSSSKGSTSEMQIIPTSSPPGTTSISKQLNDLSPSISLTAVKNSGPNKATSGNAQIKTGTTPQSLQINKVMQNNTIIRRTTSPVGASSKSSANANNNNNNSGTNQSNILARFKAANPKTSTNSSNSNNNPPPLHRANTTLGGTTKGGSSINVHTKSNTSGLTITNIKPPTKQSQNIPNKSQMNASVNQASTLAKQQAAALVAKSNIQRTSASSSSAINNATTSNPSTLQKSSTSSSLPSISAVKRAIIKRASPSTPNKLPAALSSSPSVTVTSSNKLPIITNVKSMSPSMAATISKTALNKAANAGSGSLQNKPSVSNVSKTLAQMQKRLPSSMTASPSSSSAAANSPNTMRNTVNIRPVDNKHNPSGVYIIETNINDKKVAIGAPTKSGGGTTVTKVPLQNPNKRKGPDLTKDFSTESKRMKN